MGMSDKAIKWNIYNKLTEWIDTLPVEIRDDVRKGIIVTGGCIASMYLGEKINDYDVYFKNTETASLVAKYYLSMLNDKSYAKTEVKLHDNRVEIFIQSKGILTTDDFNILDEDSKYIPKCLSSNAITLSDGIQLITRFVGDVRYIHENFDFIHATGVYDYEHNTLEISNHALKSLLSKTLYYNGSKYPLCSIFRLRKFLNRGWKINAGQLTKIGFQISQLNLNDVDVLTDQLTGVDIAYMYALIEAINNVPDEHRNDEDFLPYVCDIIDVIFGDGVDDGEHE